MSILNRHDLLRGALLVDGVVSAAMGLLLVAAGGPAAGLLGLPEALLRGAGLLLLPFAAGVLWLARDVRPPAVAVKAVIGVNVAWVMASIVVLVAGWVTPTALGLAFVVAQALAVAVLAELQLVGWRRSLRSAMAAAA